MDFDNNRVREDDRCHTAWEEPAFVQAVRLAILDDIKAKAQAIVEWAEDFAKELNSVTTAPKSAATPEGDHDAAE